MCDIARVADNAVVRRVPRLLSSFRRQVNAKYISLAELQNGRGEDWLRHLILGTGANSLQGNRNLSERLKSEHFADPYTTLVVWDLERALQTEVPLGVLPLENVRTYAKQNGFSKILLIRNDVRRTEGVKQRVRELGVPLEVHSVRVWSTEKAEKSYKMLCVGTYSV